MPDFTETIRRYTASGTGVIAVRTRDPVSTVSKVTNFCSASSRPIRLWDCARGWIEGDDPVQGQSAGDLPSVDLRNVLNSILSPDTQNGKMPPNAFFALMNPHLFIKKQEPNPVLVQLLSNLAHQLTENFRRLILTVPTHFSFPAELAELIPIIDDLPPTVDELADSVDITLSDFREKAPKIITRLGPGEAMQIAQSGVGMIQLEFESALARVASAATEYQKPTTCESIRRAVLREKADMVKRNRSLEVLSPVSPEQVGGLHNLKEWIATRASAMDPESWEEGVDKPKGCALVGVPGGGKSLCAKMVGSVLGVATIRFDIASVFAGLVGASEENMREALFMLQSLAPCVVLIDEIDKAVSVSSGGDGGTSQKVLGTLLTFMQETTAPIFWMLTMNRTDNIPAELLRAGRLDQVFGVGVPNADERMEILRYHLSARKVNPDSIDNLDVIINATDRFVGAEIEAIASEARLLAYNDDVRVSLEHLMTAHSRIRPLSRKMSEQFAAMENWCKENATPASRDSTVATIPQEMKPSTRARRRVIN